MKKGLNSLLLTLVLLLSLNSFGQHPTYRSPYYNYGLHYKAIISLAAGPETVIGFPPKLSLHIYMPRQRVAYAGVDLGFCSFGFSATAGGTAGVKLGVFLLENTFSWTSVYQAHAPNKKWLSNNPKIGIEIQKFTFKLGPSFIIREYNGHHDLQDLIMVGNQRFNIEIGYIFGPN